MPAKRRKSRKPRFYRVMKQGVYHGLFQSKHHAIEHARAVGADRIDEAIGGKPFKTLTR
jgi:hypothetical protein